MNDNPKLLRALIDNSADAFQVVDPATGRFLDVNDSTCRALGYSRDELLELTVFDVVAELDRARFFARVAEAKKAGHLTVETRHRRKDGTLYPVEVNLTLVTADRDYLVVVERDISGRKQAEEALRESQALYQSLVGQMPVGVFRKDRAGRYVFVNPQFCELHDLTEDQILGWTPDEFVAQEEAAHGRTRPGVLQRLRNGNTHHQEILRTGRPIYVEEVHDLADGSKRYLQVVKSAVFGSDGQITGTQGVQLDITDRKRAEMALQETQALYQSLVGQMPAGLFRKDPEGRYVFVNPVFCQLKGLSAEEILGKTPKELDEYERAQEASGRLKHLPQQRTLVKQGTDHHETIMRTGETIEVEEAYLQPNGTVEYFHAVKTPVFDAEGRVIGSQGMQFDITERKLAETELHREQDRWQALLDNSPDKIYFKDSQSRFVRCSQAMIAQFGVKSMDDLKGKTDFNFFTEAHARPAFEDEQEIIRTGRPMVGREECEVWSDGRITWVTSTKLPWRDETGKIIGIMGISRDITDRKQADNELQMANRALRLISLCNQEMVRATDELALLKAVCRLAVEIGGYRLAWIGFAEQDEAKSVRPVAKAGFEDGYLNITNITWDDAERGRGPVGTAIRTGKPVVIHDLSTDPAFRPWREAAEQRGYASCIALPLTGEGCCFGALTIYAGEQGSFNTGEIGLLSELTNDLAYGIGALRHQAERQRAENALRDNEAFLNTVIEGIPHMIFVKEAKDLRFVRFNKASEELLGYSRAEMVGKNDYDFFPKELANYFTEKDRQVLRGKVVVDIPEESVQTSHQGVRIMHTKKIPVFDNAGQPLYLLGISEDITDRKRAEKQVRQLSRAVEQSPASIVITDRVGNIEYVNPKFTAVSGYSAEEVIGKNPRFLKSGETPVEEYRHMWQTIMAGKEWQGEFHNRKKNGELYWESASISALFDDKGKIAHFVAVKEDITERKLAQEKLRLRESFLSAISENQPGLLWLKDAEGRYLTVNGTFAAACGRGDPEQVQGLTDFDLWPSELAEKYRTDDQRVMTTGQPVVLEEMIVVGDKSVWHETFKTPLRDDEGRVIGTTGFALDITGRKQAEQQLVEAFSFNNKIIADASVGLVAFKASGQCMLANEAAARILNATVPKLLAQDFRKIASWRASGLLQSAEESLAAKAPRHCEINFVSSFGKELSLVCHFSPFVQNGEPHLLLIFNDVTEKKKLESQFLRTQRMESIGTLAGGIAHDLNNILAPLLVSIHLLGEKITDAEGRNLLAMLETNVNRGSDLVKQVLAFGRGMAGERVQVQLKHIAKNMQQIVRETFPKSVQLRLDLARQPWLISGDATQIEQVLLNLCVNARDAMSDGGTLTLGMENKVLDEAYAAANLEARPGRYVVITVGDTGAGMTRAVQERIFEPFYTTKEHGKGTGLGLSTSLAIVKGHGGFIHCYSELGKGTVFRVYLPADATASAESAPAEKPRLPCGHNELVLVVDDEEAIRNVARQILERFGYRVLPAANGAEAVALYQTRGQEIAVVLTDMSMPVMDGAATIAALKAINPGVKIIGSSGLNSRVKTDASIRHFIRKPYTAETLLNELNEILRENSGK